MVSGVDKDLCDEPITRSGQSYRTCISDCA
jgi:hypothetical protein